MTITSAAQKIILQEMEKNQMNAIELITRACPCCGCSFECSLIHASRRTLREESHKINGIDVVMDATTKRQSLYVTVDEEDGKLLIRDETPAVRIHGYRGFSLS